MSFMAFLITGSVLLLALVAARGLAHTKRRLFRARLEVAEDHLACTGQQRPGLHLSTLAAELSSSWFLAGNHVFKAKSFLRLSLANAKVDNLEEMIRLSLKAGREYRRIRHRTGETFRHTVKEVGVLNARIGLELNRLGYAEFAYEKLKLGLDLLGQYLEGGPVLRQVSVGSQSALEELPEAQPILREASQTLRSLIQNAMTVETEDQRFSSALKLIDVLPYDFLNPKDKSEVLQLLKEAFTARAAHPDGKSDTVGLEHLLTSGGRSRNALSMFAQAEQLFDQGQFLGSLLTVHTAFGQALQDGDLLTGAAALGLCGNSCLALGRPSEALVYLWACDVFVRLSPDGHNLQAELAAALGNVFRSLGRVDDALPCLKSSIMLARGNSHGRTLMAAYLDLARVYLYKQAYDDAEEAIVTAHKVAASLRPKLKPVDVSQLHMTDCLFKLSQLLNNPEKDSLAASAEGWYKLVRSLSAYVGRHSPVRWRLLDSLDEVWQRPQRIVARHLKRAWELSLMSSDQPSHIAASFYYGLYLEKVKKDPRRAASLFEKAAEVLDTTRGNIVELGYRKSFAAQNTEIYDHLLSCCAQMGDLERAFAAAERSRARALFELLQNEPLDHITPLGRETALSREPGSELPSDEKIKSILDQVLLRSRLAGTVARVPCMNSAEVCRSLAPGECLLQFHMLMEETYIFAIDRSGIVDVFKAQYGHRLLDGLLRENEVQKRMDELEKTGSDLLASDREWSSVTSRFEAALCDVLDTLSREFIEGTRGLRSGITLRQHLAPDGRSAFTSIVLVPHRALWAVPLHCLKVSGQFLVDLESPTDEYVTVSYVHSSTVLVECRTRSRIGTRQLLVIAHPAFKDTVQGWLPRDNVEVWVNSEATEILQRLNGTNRAENLTNFLDIHFATHGRFVRDDPVQSHLDLGGKRYLTLANLLLELETNLVDCAFLAACSSGHVELDASADYLGIVTGFLKGGARNVVSTFWPVEEPVCAELEKAYYQYRDENSSCQALNKALREVRQTRNPPMWEWAAFYCLGAGADS